MSGEKWIERNSLPIISHIQNCAVNAIFFNFYLIFTAPAGTRQSTFCCESSTSKPMRNWDQKRIPLSFPHSCECSRLIELLVEIQIFSRFGKRSWNCNKMMICLQTGRGAIMRLWSVIMMMIAVLIICGHFHRRSKLISNLFLLARFLHILPLLFAPHVYKPSTIGTRLIWAIKKYNKAKLQW